MNIAYEKFRIRYISQLGFSRLWVFVKGALICQKLNGDNSVPMQNFKNSLDNTSLCFAGFKQRR